MNDERDFYEAIAHFEAQRYQEVVRLTTQRLTRPGADALRADTYYLQARALAACGQSQAAKVALGQSLAAGFYAVQHMKTDDLLLPLYSPEDWQAQLQIARSNLTALVNTHKTSMARPSYDDRGDDDSAIVFQWASLQDNDYQLLRTRSGLSGGFTDCMAAIAAVGHFVKNLWRHSASHAATVGTSIAILNDAAEGKCFRCLEYSLVFCDLISAMGFRARVLYLFTAKVASTKLGQSHVVAEVFCDATQQWVMVDVQWGLVPTYQQRLLTVFELQALLFANSPIEWCSVDQPVDDDTQLFYELWIMPYLYFLGVLTDQTPATPIEEKTEMALVVPNREPLPPAFQGEPLPWLLFRAGADLLRRPPAS